MRDAVSEGCCSSADRSFIKLNIYTDYHECFELINDIFYKVQVNEL